MNPACTGNYVSITVIGFNSIEWIGIENGYTQNGKNNSNTLDPDPNYGVSNSPVKAVRVFPENKTPSDSEPKLYVNLKVILSVPPVKYHPLFIRTFDIDDPSNETTFVDPNDSGADVGIYKGDTDLYYTNDQDNRGEVIITSGTTSKSGHYLGENIGSTPFFSLYVTTPIYSKEINFKFKVSQYCGDNYRSAITNDQYFFYYTRNLDQFDGQGVFYKHPDKPDIPIEIDQSLCSPVLTVWRTLHIEHDKMKNPGWSQNLTPKLVFSHPSPALSLCKTIKDISYPPLLGINPASPILDDGSEGGRFNDGYLLIGESELTSTKNVIESNTNNEVTLYTPQDLSFGKTLSAVIKKASHPDLHFYITDIFFLNTSNLDATVYMKSSVSNLSHYHGGDLSIDGGEFTSGGKVEVVTGETTHFIVKSSAPNKSSLIIPIQVRDDDQIPESGKSTIIPDNLYLVDVNTVLKKVYIVAVEDGAGNILNNSKSIVFKPNIRIEEVDPTDPTTGPSIQKYYQDYCNSESNRSENYWATYILSAWQAGINTDYDRDYNPILSSGEIALGGQTYGGNLDDCYRAKGCNFFVLFWESLIDCDIDWQYYIVQHELGHIFGLSHGDVYCGGNLCAESITYANDCLGGVLLTDMGVMARGYGSAATTSGVLSIDYIPFHINMIRGRSKCPGQ